MSPGTRETIEILSSLAGSFLLLLIFLILVAASVLLWFVGRGLRAARRRSVDIAAWIGEQVGSGQRIAADSMAQVVEPQIQALSAWVGVKAGVAALLQGSHSPEDRSLAAQASQPSGSGGDGEA